MIPSPGRNISEQRQHWVFKRWGGRNDAWRPGEGEGVGEHWAGIGEWYWGYVVFFGGAIIFCNRSLILWWSSPTGCRLSLWGRTMGVSRGGWGRRGRGAMLMLTMPMVVIVSSSYEKGWIESKFPSAGGLVTAVAPVVVESAGTWVTTKNIKIETNSITSNMAGWLDRSAWLLSFIGRNPRVHISKSLPPDGRAQVRSHRSHCHRVQDGVWRLLQRMLQRHVLAALPQHAGQGGVQQGDVARLRDGQQRVWLEDTWSCEEGRSNWGGDSKEKGDGATGVAARLSPHAGGQHNPRCLCRGGTKCQDGILPPHPFPFLGHNADLPMGRRNPPRHAWLWPGGLPHRGLLPQLPWVLQQKSWLQSG